MKKLLAVTVLATASVASMQSQAFKFDTPSDWDIRWDNTAKGNLMMRVEDQDPSIYDPNRTEPSATAAGISDDADYSVKQGHFVSQRFDLLSEMDVVWKDKLGFRVSGAGWYDFAYDGSGYPESGPTKGYPSAYSTFAYLTVQPGEYNDAAKDLHYRGGELLDAFVFANFEIGSASANLRVGRHTLYWGQSLLATGAIHGFAGSMAALDLAKGLGTPGSEAKELFIPNDKISSTVQFAGGVSVSAFYAMGFEPLRWPAAGTYFSLNEALTENSECLTVGQTTSGTNNGTTDGRTCFRSVNYKSKDSGDWGINVKYYIEPLDLEASVIYMNNTDRLTSGLYSALGVTDAQKAEAANTNASIAALYGWVYKSDIETFGISLSKQYWDISWGADFVYRLNDALSPDLTSSLGAFYTSVSEVGPGNDYPGPTGDTAHIVINGVGLLDGGWGLWDGGSYIGELTLSQLVKWGRNGPDATVNKANTYIKDDNLCSNISGVFKPTWYQVRPGWDLSALSSLSYTLTCKQAPNSAGGNEKIGNGSVGLSVDIEQIWNVALNYNMYFGPQKNGTAAFIKDRDNIALTVKRTF